MSLKNLTTRLPARANCAASENPRQVLTTDVFTNAHPRFGFAGPILARIAGFVKRP